MCVCACVCVCVCAHVCLLSRAVQKTFQPKVSGCEEHHQKLWSVLKDANAKQRLIAMAWIDLEKCLWISPTLSDIICTEVLQCSQTAHNLYWPTVFQPVGMCPDRLVHRGNQNEYQCLPGWPPISVNFNTVIGTLVDTIQVHCSNLGYLFPGSLMWSVSYNLQMTLVFSRVALPVVNRWWMSLTHVWPGHRWRPSHLSAKPLHFVAAPVLWIACMTLTWPLGAHSSSFPINNLWNSLECPYAPHY